MCVRCGAGGHRTRAAPVPAHPPPPTSPLIHHLFTKGPIDSLRKVFDHPMRCLGLLRYLEATRVCVKPRTTWEPG
jgi:hypothetical protein